MAIILGGIAVSVWLIVTKEITEIVLT